MPQQGGNRNAPNTSWEFEVSRGNVPGIATIRKFGYNSSMSSAGDGFSAVWPLDSSIPDYPFPQASAVLNVSSTSANDSGTAGTHARTVLIQGLNSVFEKQNEVVTLAGASSVATTNSFIRINRVAVTSVGAYGNTNQGAITITTTSSDHILAYIPAAEGITQQAIYTSPSSATAYISQINLFPQAEKTGVDFRGRVRQNADVTDTSGTIGPSVTVGSGFDALAEQIIPLESKAVLPPKTDFIFQVRNQGGANAAIKAGVAINIFEYTD